MKLIEVVVDEGHVDTVMGIAEQYGAMDVWPGSACVDGRQSIRIIAGPENRQALLDALQVIINASEHARIVISPVEAVLPRPEAEEEVASSHSKSSTTREELYASVQKGAALDSNYILLVFLSTVVAAIGLLKSNVAVVVGAMVIAPLLGPNIAMALAAALGDTELMWKGLKTSLAGLGVALCVSFLIGLTGWVDLGSTELMSRTDVGLESVALALASGAAAALSMTSGLPSVLVGVMVAVALLPPTAALGMLLGGGYVSVAAGAGLLLAINIVSVNLAAKIVFMFKGVRPRTWLEQRKARQSTAANLIFWLVSLSILVGVILLRQSLK